MLLGYAAFCWLRADYVQAQGWRQLDAPVIPGSLMTLHEGDAVGSIQIPSLHLSTVIFEGSTESTLAVGVGHVSGTGYPGKPGNVVLAGHRDSFFRPLEKVRVGDRIEVTSNGQSAVYEVKNTRIVDPSEVSVMASTGGHTVTLITCYPFFYVGSAPKRFIVQGVEKSVSYTP
ncbi:MAG: class D sortase [Acidobacteriota bacterium]